jgi:hypothetical protein
MSRTIYAKYKNRNGQDIYIIPRHIESFGRDGKETTFIKMISGEQHIIFATLTEIQEIIP